MPGKALDREPSCAWLVSKKTKNPVQINERGTNTMSWGAKMTQGSGLPRHRILSPGRIQRVTPAYESHVVGSSPIEAKATEDQHQRHGQATAIGSLSWCRPRPRISLAGRGRSSYPNAPASPTTPGSALAVTLKPGGRASADRRVSQPGCHACSPPAHGLPGLGALPQPLLTTDLAASGFGKQGSTNLGCPRHPFRGIRRPYQSFCRRRQRIPIASVRRPQSAPVSATIALGRRSVLI